MKRFVIPLIILLVVAGLSLGVFGWWKVNSAPVSSDDSEVDFLILRGRSASEIGEKLEKEGLIRNSLAFKIYVQLTGKAKKIQAGEYTLSANLPLIEVVDKLISGPDEFWVTIPEGLRREEIPDKFAESLGLSLSQAAIFREEFLKESEGKEGFLFPDTYLFPRDIKASLVVKKLTQTFDQKTNAFKEDISKSDYSLEQLVALASIIERETKTEEERPIVAGILIKRLEADWPLQADATLQYAVANSKLKAQNSKLDNWWEPLTKNDLETNSPYNSYKFTGFPPTPIANPGISSIEAAIKPQDSPYWFYLHDSEGNIHYAEIIEEHNGNVRRYLEK